MHLSEKTPIMMEQNLHILPQEPQDYSILVEMKVHFDSLQVVLLGQIQVLPQKHNLR
jgi:hypothetical protein